MGSIQTLYDALYALAVVVGIAAAITLAMVAAGAMFERGQKSAAKVGSSNTIPPHQPTPSGARELVLR